MSLTALKISKDDQELISELNDDYHNGRCVIFDVRDLRIEAFSDSFDHVVIDNGEYLIKIYSPLS